MEQQRNQQQRYPGDDDDIQLLRGHWVDAEGFHHRQRYRAPPSPQPLPVEEVDVDLDTDNEGDSSSDSDGTELEFPELPPLLNAEEVRNLLLEGPRSPQPCEPNREIGNDARPLIGDGGRPAPPMDQRRHPIANLDDGMLHQHPQIPQEPQIPQQPADLGERPYLQFPDLRAISIRACTADIEANRPLPVAGVLTCMTRFTARVVMCVILNQGRMMSSLRLIGGDGARVIDVFVIPTVAQDPMTFLWRCICLEEWLEGHPDARLMLDQRLPL